MLTRQSLGIDSFKIEGDGAGLSGKHHCMIYEMAQ